MTTPVHMPQKQPRKYLFASKSPSFYRKISDAAKNARRASKSLIKKELSIIKKKVTNLDLGGQLCGAGSAD